MDTGKRLPDSFNDFRLQESVGTEFIVFIEGDFLYQKAVLQIRALLKNGLIPLPFGYLVCLHPLPDMI